MSMLRRSDFGGYYSVRLLELGRKSQTDVVKKANSDEMARFEVRPWTIKTLAHSSCHHFFVPALDQPTKCPAKFKPS